MARMKIQIDGNWIEADPGETVSGVAERQGIEIPHLCHDPQLEPFASCFVCVVQVKGVPNLLPACSAKVTDGMVVETRNAKIEASRKAALELLLSNHFADCLAPCRISCPAGVDVQGYIALSVMGKHRDALRLIKETNPLPAVCGRVCTRPCELNCRRLLVEESVAIDDIKRYVSDQDLFSGKPFLPEKKPPRPEKVAIIGAGPAGLSCGYYLAVEGCQVDIFEAQEKAGGMLRYGIPQYRLPDEILDKEIEGITGLGVAVHTGKKLGRDITLDGLFEQGYSSVFLALGAQVSTPMDVPGRDLENVLAGIDFLAQVERGEAQSLTGTVAVIGGGSTAVDAARTSLRMGAERVVMVYRRTIKEMPAHGEEVKAAREEGIEMQFLTNPTEYQGENGKVSQIVCIKMELGEPDESGRRRPVPVAGSEFTVAADHVIEAVGQKPELSGLPAGQGNGDRLETGWGDTVKVDKQTMATSLPGVYAAGDVVLGPATVVEAIGGGRKAAGAILHYISGENANGPKEPFLSRRDNFRRLIPQDYSAVNKTSRHARPETELNARVKSFEEVELAFPEKDVLAEAGRCMECGCKVFFDCDLQRCATEYEADQRAYDGEFQEHTVDYRHPFIELNMNKCILCAKCVRICREVVGLNALSFNQRGFGTEITPSLGGSLTETACISCGQCADICPTGAIVDVFNTPKPGPWDTVKRRTLCDFCGVGCELDAHVLGGQIVRVSRRPDAKANPFGNLCFKGRYGFRHEGSEDQITQPYLRREGELQPAAWDEIVSFITEKLNGAGETLLGENAAVMVAPRLTIEEQYQIQKFARLVLKTNHIGTNSEAAAILNEYAPLIASNATLRDVTNAEAILLLKTDLLASHPVAAFELYKYCLQGGEAVIAGGSSNYLPGEACRVKVEDGHWGLFFELLSEIFQGTRNSAEAGAAELPPELGLSPEGRQTLQSLASKKAVLVWDPAQWNRADLPGLIRLLSAARNAGLRLLTMAGQANTLGMHLSGAMPARLPDGLPLAQGKEAFSALWNEALPESPGKNPDALWELWRNQPPGAVWVFGEDPLGTARDSESAASRFRQAGLGIVADVLWTKSAKEADVVLPLPSILEKDGLLVNCENRLQRVNPVLERKTGLDLFTMLEGIARALNCRQMATSPAEVREELARAGSPINQETVHRALEGEVFVSDCFGKDGTTPPEEAGQAPAFSAFCHQADGLEKWVQEFARNTGIRI